MENEKLRIFFWTDCIRCQPFSMPNVLIFMSFFQDSKRFLRDDLVPRFAQHVQQTEARQHAEPQPAEGHTVTRLEKGQDQQQQVADDPEVEEETHSEEIPQERQT